MSDMVVVEVKVKTAGSVPRREQRRNVAEMAGFLKSVPNIKCESDQDGCSVSGDYSAVLSALKDTREYMDSRRQGWSSSSATASCCWTPDESGYGDFQDSFEIIADGTPGMKEALEEVVTPTMEAQPTRFKMFGGRGRSSSSDGIVQVMPDIPQRKRVFSYDGSDEQKQFYEEWHSQY
ncbi:hypothetical protein FOZ60_005196 [Perkinsus olseni]|uniref:Uncharacterized protein n=1 Tax=Perkinsus olseni TaxID=32597 RepID=A0A7J6NRH2_PEROL|nr:hypothetical protein FOZ60_005196 [Perkinsus olseni]